LCALIEAAGQPTLEALAADWPIFLVAAHIKAGVSNIIAIVEQLDRRRELDQNIGLLFFQFARRTGLLFFFVWRRWARACENAGKTGLCEGRDRCGLKV